VTLTQYNKGLTFADGYNVLLTGCAPANELSYAAGDYDSFSDTPLSDEIAYADLDGVEIFTLTAAGRSYLNKTGYTPLMVRTDWDVENSFGSTWGAGLATTWKIRGKTYETEGSRPKLTIEYTLGGGGLPVFDYYYNHMRG